jgi:hypothetical protein
MPPDAGAKFLQDLQYGSEAWSRSYYSLRNTIEGVNGIAKDGAHEALGIADRRRIRGQAAQTVFVALLILGTNLRKLDTFRRLGVVDGDGVIRLPKRARRRRTASLADHVPVSARPDDTLRE